MFAFFYRSVLGFDGVRRSGAIRSFLCVVIIARRFSSVAGTGRVGVGQRDNLMVTGTRREKRPNVHTHDPERPAGPSHAVDIAIDAHDQICIRTGGRSDVSCTVRMNHYHYFDGGGRARVWPACGARVAAILGSCRWSCRVRRDTRLEN